MAASKQDEPRYFVVGAEGDKGPFSAAQIRSSLTAGRLSVDAELREAATVETLKAGDLPRPMPTAAAAPTQRPRRVTPRRDEIDDEPVGDTRTARERRIQDPGGSFWLGFFAGAFLGVLVVFAVHRFGRADTRRGVLWGAGLQLAIFLVSRAAA